MSRQIFYLNKPHHTLTIGDTNDKLGKAYSTEIKVQEERYSYVLTVLRRFGGQDYKRIGWRMIKNGKEVAIPLHIKNNLELR